MSERDDLLRRMRELVAQARALRDAALLDELRALLDPAPAAATAAAASVAAPSALAAVAAAAAGEVPIWHGIVGACAQLVAMRAKIERFAAVAAPVLIRGESGTGKDLVAHALHDLGPRRTAPFVSESCAAIPQTLLESVLFGHVKGAFTGAVRDHPGHFLAADSGTLFLDEIGDMPLAMQVKLLRVLQEGEVRPVGGTKVRKVDVRVVAATNQDLARLVRDGRFREDLFYRLNVLQLDLPPLRERGEDVVVLARWFLARAAARGGRSLRLAADAEQRLRDGKWPGNVRQLQNEMQRLAALCDDSVVRAQDLAVE